GKASGKRRDRAMAARGVGQTGSLDRRRRPRPDKTALVLGGGGFTGGVYEIGALRALDLLAANTSVNQFDVYVGTSAGSFIAALCANGVSPEEMMRVVTRQGKAPFKDINLNDLLRPNVVEFARKGALLPLRAASLARNVIGQWGAVSLMDVFLGLAEGLPSGAYTVAVTNPIVPFVNDFETTIRTLRGTRRRRVSDMGFPQIGYQAFKLVAHQRLHELAKGWEQRYPGVDIILIEPEPTDELMFQTSMMNFASRVEIARHGFESVTEHLAGEYDRYEEVCKRHGIEI